MSRPCEGRKRTRFTQNMNACRATANSVHTSPYRGLNRCYRGLNEAQPRSKRGATTVQTRRYRGSNEALPRSMLAMNAVALRLKCKRIIPCLWSVLYLGLMWKAPHFLTGILLMLWNCGTWRKLGDLMYETPAQLQEGPKVMRQSWRLKTLFL